MFRDTKEALRRLEKELLEDEDGQQVTPEIPDLPDGRVYNTDSLDTDPEGLSEELLQPERENLSGLVALVFILLGAILLVLGFIVLRTGGWL